MDNKASAKSLTATPAGQSIYIGLWILGTLVVFGAAVGAFFFGDYLGNPGDTEEAVVEEPSLELPDLTLGPQVPGVWAWNELRGGECIGDYDDAFAEEFEVVSCVSPHEAQLVKAQLISEKPDAPFPGEEELLQQAKQVCEVENMLSRETIQNYNDLVVQVSYPVDQEMWTTGDRVVYCFVARQSGGALTESLLQSR